MSHGRDNRAKPYGVVAEYESGEALMVAAKQARAEGYRDMDAYSPLPVHGLADVIGFKDDRLGWIVFVHGVLGFVGGYLLQWWTSQGIAVPPGRLQTALSHNGLLPYPMNVGGKPLFSLPAFFPPAFETTILLAAFGATFGMFALNGLPKPHHPVFNAKNMARASSDRYCLCIEATDPRYDEDAVVEMFAGTGAISVERVMTSEGY